MSPKTPVPSHRQAASRLWRQSGHRRSGFDPLSEAGVWRAGAVWFPPPGGAFAGNASGQESVRVFVHSPDQSAKAGADLIVCGAGLATDLPELVASA